MPRADHTPTVVYFVEEASTALSDSYSTMTLNGASAGATPLPMTGAFLSCVDGKIDTIALSAASITWYLSRDSAGDEPITDEVTETIVTGKTTGTDGGVSTTIGRWYLPSVEGTVYLNAKTDTGTCNMVPRLYWVT